MRGWGCELGVWEDEGVSWGEWEDEGVRSWCVGVYTVCYVWKHDIYIYVALTYRVGISSGMLAVVNQNSSHIMVSSYVESIAVNNGSDVMTFENCTMQLSLWTESHYCTPKPRMAAIDVTAMYGSVIKKVNPFSCSPEWLLWQLNLPMQEQAIATLVQVPSETIQVTFLPLQKTALMPGDHFELNFALVLLPVYDTEAHDMVLAMDMLDPYLNETLTMTVDYRNGTVATIGKPCS